MCSIFDRYCQANLTGPLGLVLTLPLALYAMTGSTGTPCEPAQIDSIELLEDVLEFVPDGFNQRYVVKRPDFHDGAKQHSRFDRQLRGSPRFFRAALTPSNDHNRAGVGCNPRQLSTEGRR